MKKLLSVLFVFVLFLSVTAQKKTTDKERSGLIGSVKSVKEDNHSLSESEKSNAQTKCVFCFESYYDKDGNLTEFISPGLTYKSTKNTIDGFETYKISYLVESPKYNGFFSSPTLIEKPIEEPERLLPPNTRYDSKYIYEYDSSGRIKTSRQFQNDGKLITKSTYTYGLNNKIAEELYETRSDKSQISSTYDEKGNLIERISVSQSRVSDRKDNKSKDVYSNYKFDSQGNWIERKKTSTYYSWETPSVIETLEIRTITYLGLSLFEKI